DDTRTVVRAASVAGRRVSHELLARVVDVDVDGMDRALRAAVERNALVPVGADSYAFRHALLAEAVYDDLLPGNGSGCTRRTSRPCAAVRSTGRPPSSPGMPGP